MSGSIILNGRRRSDGRPSPVPKYIMDLGHDGRFSAAIDADDGDDNASARRTPTPWPRQIKKVLVKATDSPMSCSDDCPQTGLDHIVHPIRRQEFLKMASQYSLILEWRLIVKRFDEFACKAFVRKTDGQVVKRVVVEAGSKSGSVQGEFLRRGGPVPPRDRIATS